MAVPARVIARRARWRRRARRGAWALVLLIVAAIGYAFYSQAAAVWALRAETRALQTQIVRLEETNRALAARLRLRDDPDYLELLIRRELGLIRPGELKFILPPELP